MIKLITLLFTYILFGIGPYFNGSFYPKTKTEIEKYLEDVLNKTPTNQKVSKTKIAIVPHAGYIFSAYIAANIYKSIPKAKTYFIISPSHRYWFENILLCDENFETPLGKIETDNQIIKDLSKNNDLFSIDCSKFINEHAIEVQLPFIQHRFKNDFKIVPLMINTQNLEKISLAAKLIDKTIKEKKDIFFLISSDLSHYPSYEKAKIADLTLLNSIKTMDIYYIDLTSKILLSKKIPNYQTSACGLSGILLGVELAKLNNLNNFDIISYLNSHDTNPNISSKYSVVGYTASIFSESKNKEKDEYRHEEKKILLKMARHSIEETLNKKDTKLNQSLYDNTKFNLPKAVFVTLTKNGNLRGCMGTTQPQMSLADAVKYYAKLSAFGDPRFMPLKKEELNETKIEISILSPLKKVNHYKEIIEKKNGVVISSKNGSGLFLPQVWEFFKTKEEFLSELCSQKAGLPSDCWKSNDIDIYVFDVEKFSE